MNLLLPTDGCPDCVFGTPVHPFDIDDIDDSGLCLQAFYQCPRCGFLWDTYWALDAVDLACPGCPECSTERKSA